MIATLAEGNTDLADILFLVAFILFTITTVLYLMARSVVGALTTAGLASVALALLVL